MFEFLWKGVLRDRSRSLFPILIIAGGVFLAVLFSCWMNGVIAQMIFDNARFETGHVKIVSRAYKENIDQRPYDLTFLENDKLLKMIKKQYPEMIWQQRIYFGGLVDVPDSTGATKMQGEFSAIALDLLHNEVEKELFNLDQALIAGKLPKTEQEILMSSELAKNLGLSIGEEITLISSTMFSAMTIQNFKMSGFIKFGTQALDKTAILLDITAARDFLNMENTASEILGFLPKYRYHEEKLQKISDDFNHKFSQKKDEFSPIMIPLKEQANMRFILEQSKTNISLILFVFIFVMSLVLWNAGLRNGIRRYGEIGVRLALGETKAHIYLSMIWEAIIIGFFASVIGTALGLAVSYYLQIHGINISGLMKNVSMVMGSTMRAQVTAKSYMIGFVPGLFASVLGAIFSGIGIYRRQTAQLFKELEE